VAEWPIDGQPVRRATELDAELAMADVTILLQDHSVYDLDNLVASSRLLLDTRGRLAGSGSPNTETL
jgi:UDP-N-acetyl-D-mannosaminuronate dehydrogenase